nr:N-formylglutamate amidohydrolase [Sphingobium boeckii]
MSVPHAGRDYPEPLLRASRITPKQLELLEDRHADRIAAHAIARGYSAIVAQRARAWIDLNRHEREIDPEMIDPRPSGDGLIRSSKVTGGLGLMPRRLRGSGDILSRRVPAACLEARIEIDHRPYHRRLSEMLKATRDRFGLAILLDIHSMPPVASGAGIVIGDLFGRSAGSRHSGLVHALTKARGFSVAMNVPYAGGHILSTHGQPARGIHAIQIEFDRALYLQPDMSTLRPDIGGLDRLITRIAESLCADIAGRDTAIAAE